MSEELRELGRFLAGEIPLPISYTYQDADGATLTGISAADWTGYFRYRREGAASRVERSATISAGTLTWTPVAADFATAGEYVGEFWAEKNDGTAKIASKIGWRWTVYVAGSVVPTAPDNLTGIVTGPPALWAQPTDICAPCSTDAFTPGLVDRMLRVATDVLYELSGRQYPGVLNAVVHPTVQCSCAPARRTGLLWTRHHLDDPCRQRITLGAYPLRTVTEVIVDGEVVASDAYRIESNRYLARIDGGSWPAFTDDDDPDAFKVTLTWGLAPPASGVAAAAALACQLLLATDPNADGCQLPERVQVVSRQGVSFALIDPMEFLTEGRTGIYLVDLFLGSVNPNGLRQAPMVVSPDVGPAVRRYS